MGADSVINYVLEKMKELVLVVENIGGYLVGWLEKVLPPETRGKQLIHWLKVVAPFIITMVVLFTCCRCCCRGGRRSVKMMKAPGRNYRMPRHVFESDPRSYFLNLRAKPVDELF
uniref:Uncharacterized protein n=1 Tax=Davidia involucrata TaxID=16924 RepID=A0A5B7BZW9_DAVIN